MKNKPAWQKDLYNGIGGKVELSDTSPKEAMIREFKEETGVLNNRWTHYATMLGPCNRDAANWLVHVYYSILPDAEFYKIKTMESEEVTKLPLTSLPNIRKQFNLSWLIPLALEKINGMYYSAKII